MATGVSVKMGVTGVSTFKRDINDAKATVVAMTAALKMNESQLKLTGDEEANLRTKVYLLKVAIDAQTEIVKKAHAALADMKNKGIDPASKKFKDMETEVYKASTKLNEMKAELKGVEDGSKGSADGLKKTDDTVTAISKNKAWDNVADGIGKITKTLEKGARAAVNFGKKIMSSLKDSTGWADDLLTLSTQTDIDVETLQKMEHLADIVDTDVDAIIKAKQRMRKAAAGEGAEDISELFGIDVSGYENPDDLFWDLGDAILNMGDAFDKEAAAQKVFGRNWTELLPIFKLGRTEYEKMLNEQTYLTEDQVKSLGRADDEIKKFEQEIAQLKNQFWSDNADKITELLQWLVDNKNSVYNALKVIGAGFGLLKIAEFAANMGKTLTGFQEILRLAGKGGTGTTATGGGGGTGSVSGWAKFIKDIGPGGVAGLGGVATILTGFAWAANRRLNNREQVRGTDEYLGAKSGGVELTLAEWIKAQAAMNDTDFMLTATSEEVETLQNRINDLYAQLQSAEGGMDAVSAYSAWRQERSLGNQDWILPESLERMTSEAERSSASQIQSNSEMTAAAGELKGLPAAVAAAVRSGMSGVTIIIGDGAVGEIGRRVGGSMANSVRALLN